MVERRPYIGKQTRINLASFTNAGGNRPKAFIAVPSSSKKSVDLHSRCIATL